MIVAIYKGMNTEVLTEDEPNKHVNLNFLNGDGSKNFNTAVLLNNVGYTVLLTYKNFEELTMLLEYAKHKDHVTVFVVYPEVSLYKMFIEPDVYNKTSLSTISVIANEKIKELLHISEILDANEDEHIIVKKVDKKDFSLKQIVSELYYNYIEINDFRTSTHKLFGGLTRDDNITLTMFSDNIVTISQELNEDKKYSLEVDIKDSDDLYKVLKYYVDDAIRKEDVFEFEINFCVEENKLSSIYDYFYKLYTINILLTKSIDNQINF